MKFPRRKILLLSVIVIIIMLIPIIIFSTKGVKPVTEVTPSLKSEFDLTTGPVQKTQRLTPTKLANPVAFPGAEGFGSVTMGGRGGSVLIVTNLDDSGPGSFRAAVEADGARIVVFQVAGTIELNSSIEIKNPYLTIAGQSAPGGGITIKSNPLNSEGTLVIATHDVIMRFIRSRPGPPQIPSENGDALEILGPDAYNIVIDHCSFSWAIDEVVSTWYDAHDITIQWSIISEGLNCSTHTKGCHSMGLLLGSEGSRDISIHHNLFAHNVQRNPLIQTSGAVDIVNNLVFDAGYTPITINDNYGAVSVNIINNYYKKTNNNEDYFISPASNGTPGLKIFVNGNITPTRPNDSLDEALVFKPGRKKWMVSNWINVPQVATTSALEAYNQVLAESGAKIGLDGMGVEFIRRDVVDEQVINDVKNGLSRIIDDPADVGGWPMLSSGSAPKDTDMDGMPDEWEEHFGFNSLNATDSILDFDDDGYTNIEEYLNQTNPLSF